jgi:hypothetical protein
VLNKLSRHVSASKCHLQGVTLSFHRLLQLFSLRFGWVWTIVQLVRPSAAEWHLETETCRGNLLSTIKSAYSALVHLLDIFHLIRKMLSTTDNLNLKVNICSLCYGFGV